MKSKITLSDGERKSILSMIKVLKNAFKNKIAYSSDEIIKVLEMIENEVLK